MLIAAAFLRASGALLAQRQVDRLAAQGVTRIGGMAMKRSRIAHGLALLSGGLLLTGLSTGLWAATSTLELLPGERQGEGESVELGAVRPIGTTPPSREAARPVPRGNPLWSVPLSALSVTQERPIFSASRRPPPRAVVAPVAEQVSAPPPPPAEPERPPLALIGAVVGDGDSIAVFVDRTSQKMIRLRPGEAHAGWVLDAVARREVTLRKADRSETIELKATDVPVQGSAPVLPVAAPKSVGTLDTNYSPFTPRSTPKNGESDGL
jgi:general secretion pathway protein N